MQARNNKRSPIVELDPIVCRRTIRGFTRLPIGHVDNNKECGGSQCGLYCTCQVHHTFARLTHCQNRPSSETLRPRFHGPKHLVRVNLQHNCHPTILVVSLKSIDRSSLVLEDVSLSLQWTCQLSKRIAHMITSSQRKYSFQICGERAKSDPAQHV